MPTKTHFTTITAIPPELSLETILETLHSHIDMIDLNPLIVDRYKTDPPSFANAEEFSCTWYTLKDKISYLPGGLVSSEIEYHGCFRDLVDGLQTHIYAPLGLEIRGRWTVGISFPDIPMEPTKSAPGIPTESLYLREDVELSCNILMAHFVKRTMKKSHAMLVDRLVEKAQRRNGHAADIRFHS